MMEAPEEQTGPEQSPVGSEAAEKPRKKKKHWLYDSLDLGQWVHHETMIRHLPFVFFLAAVAILYIANAHDARKSVREISAIEKQLNELRWEYMTTKSELERISKQSVVAERAAVSGLKELTEPPRKITSASHE